MTSDHVIIYGKYQLTTDGTITNLETGYQLKPCLNNCGYRIVSLDRHTHTIHRLLAEHFIPGQTSEACEVDHIDRCRTNNSLENLRWVTHAENMANRCNSKV